MEKLPKNISSSGTDGEMAERIRAYDWSKHPLGPMEQWPQSLRTVVQIMLGSRYAMWLGWGPEFLFFFNDAYKPTLGLKESWCLGQSAKKVWAEIWPAVGPRAESVLETGKATWDEGLLLFLERSGFPEETYHTFSYSPVPADAGGVGGMLCVVTEETERVIGERRLAFLRELGSGLAGVNVDQGIFQALTACIETRNHDLPFASVYLFNKDESQAVLQWTCQIEAGSPMAPELLNLQGDDLVWPADRALTEGQIVVVEGLDKRFDSIPTGRWDKAPREAALVPIARQGQERPAGFMVVGINPYRPFDNAYRGFLSLLAGQVGSALANAQAYELERSRAEALAEIDRAKTIFFSNVSHELRTPLTLMLGPIEDIMNESAQAHHGSHRELASVAHRNGLRLLKLVNTLLDFSRMEAGRMQASYQPVDLSSVTIDLASSFRAAIEKAGLNYEVDCPPMSEPVYVDVNLWEKIVLNLLSNAFKFTLEGGIKLSLRETGGEAILEVRDTGAGIPREAQEHLFERFYRVQGASGRTQEGTGIGLALIKELTKLHGGAVTFESEFGRGSCFKVTLPKGSAHLPQDRVQAAKEGFSTALGVKPFIEEVSRWNIDETEGESLQNPTEGSLFPPEVAVEGKPCILLADDNADMRHYVKRLLSDRFTVIAVRDGEAALEVLEKKSPDLVLSDIMMPRLDGIGLLKAIRANPRWQLIPIILLSARAGEEARLDGVSRGADDYLVKPFSARELIARVSAHVDLARVRREATVKLRENEQRLMEAQSQLAATLDAAAIGTWTWDIQAYKLIADRNIRELFGLSGEADIPIPVEDFVASIHPDDIPRVQATLNQALQGSAEVFEEDYRVLQRDGMVRWVASRGRLRPADVDEPALMSGVLIDITARKQAEEILRRNDAQIAAIIQRSPVGAFLVDSHLCIQQLNAKAYPLFEQTGAILGARVEEALKDAWPEREITELIRGIQHTLRTGESTITPGFRLPKFRENHDRYYDSEIHRHTFADGQKAVVCYFVEISAHWQAQQAAREAAEKLELALSAAKLGHWTWDAKTNLVMLSPRAAEIFQLPGATSLSRPELRKLLHPEDAERVRIALDTSIKNHAAYDAEYRVVSPVGEERWVAVKGRTVFEGDNQFLGLNGVVQDITERVRAEREKALLLKAEQDAREEAEALKEAAEALTAELDLEATVQRATDVATKLTGAKFGAFFYNVENEMEESYVLYTLSGVPKEAFAKFGLPRNTAVFGPTFKGEGVVRVDDITKDPRYGKNAPHHGMPQGHLPVRSYLAVPVIARSGEVLGGLFFGHPDPGVFTARAERIVSGIAAQASIAMDNASLYEKVQRTAERLNFSLSALNLGMWNWDMATDRITISNRTADIYGLPHGVKITRSEMRKTLHPEEQDRARHAVQEALQQNKDYDIEYRVNHPTLGLRWVAAKGRLVYGEGGKVTGMMGVVQDITERKHSEIQLRNQRDVLEQIVQSVELSEILETLVRNVEQFVDRKLIATIMLMDEEENRLHLAAGNHCPKEWREYVKIVPVGPGEGSCGTCAHSRERVIVQDVEHDPLWSKYKDKALEMGLRACWSTPILSSTGKVLGTFAIYYCEASEPTAHEIQIVDVTTRTAAIAIERKQSEAALQASQAQLAEYAQTLEAKVLERTTRLQETIAELEAFSYSVSHDLRAPLRAMQGYTQALLTDYRSKLDAEASHYLERIGRNAERLELLVRDILAYSRVAKEHVELTSVSLAPFLENLLALSPHLQPPHAEIIMERSLPTVLAHEAYLSQVLSNLLGNAVKFVKPGVVPRIVISSQVEGAFARITVKDNGLGIDNSHFKRIFQIFGRVYPDKNYEGTGIGLAIVKKAVERMGGEIGVESALGDGSSFWFTLKLQ